MVEGPHVVTVGSKDIHERVLATAGNGEIEARPRRDRRAMHEDKDGQCRGAGLRLAQALSVHGKRYCSLFGPVLAAPDLSGRSRPRLGWRLSGSSLCEP